MRVDAGEPFAVETDDASSGLLAAGDKPPSVQNVPYVRHSPAKANPVGGPVFVEGGPRAGEHTPDRWYWNALEELEAQGHLDPASHKVSGGDACGRLSAEGRWYLRSAGEA